MLDQLKYTFVTVAQECDWSVLELQARSLSAYVSEDILAEIIVVENSALPDRARFHDQLLREYGALAGKVRFLTAAEVAEVPAGAGGWYSQQILKLAVSREVSTERYVTLDAKNHLVFPLERNYLEQGPKIRSWRQNYESTGMRPFLENGLRYFGLNANEYVRNFMPTVTPFTFPTGPVRDLVACVVEREGRPFADAFLDLGFAEFFLFAAFIAMLGKTEELYDFSGAPCRIIWEHDALQGATSVRRHIALTEQCALPMFGVHRRAEPMLDGASRRAVAQFWQRRGLFSTLSGGLDFLSSRASLSKGNHRVYRRWKYRLSRAAESCFAGWKR